MDGQHGLREIGGQTQARVWIESQATPCSASSTSFSISSTENRCLNFFASVTMFGFEYVWNMRSTCRTGVSYWYSCFQCFCPADITSTSLYSIVLFFCNSAILDFATSHYHLVISDDSLRGQAWGTLWEIIKGTSVSRGTRAIVSD